MDHERRSQVTLFMRSARSYVAVIGLLLVGCSYDWTVPRRDGGALQDANAADDAADAVSDDDVRDGEVYPALEDDGGISNVPNASRPCSEGCGANSSCDVAEHLCVCDADYVEGGAGCVPDPCRSGNTCTSPLVCVARAGEAQCECTGGTSLCGTSCLDTRSDDNNCGACGRTCATGLHCEQSLCGPRIHSLHLTEGESCALFEASDGNYPIRCWGWNSLQLFRNGSSEALSPAEITGVPTARAMTSTVRRRCVVPADRDVVRCWGECRIECGLPSTSSKPTIDFVDIAIADVAGLSTGSAGASPGNNCAVTAAGIVYCLGSAAGSTAATDRLFPAPISVRDVPDARFSAISGWGTVSCGLMRDHRVACWGKANASSQLGVADANLPGSPFPAVIVQKENGGDLTEAMAISMGWTVGCAITSAGELWCWGGNQCGQLGIGDGDVHNGAVRVALTDVAEVAAGEQFVCARQTSGQVWCWGDRERLGIGTFIAGDLSTTCFSTPQALAALPDARILSAGSSHACAQRTNGQLFCWGRNVAGQIGDGTKVERHVPTVVTGLQQP